MDGRVVTMRLAKARAVETAAAQAEAVESRLGEILTGAAGAGGARVDVGDLHLVLAALLAADRRALEEAHAAHREELHGEARARQRRDATAAKLRARVSSFRGLFDLEHGTGAGSRLLGLDGRTVRRPEDLCRQAERIVARLGDERRPLPEPPLPMIVLDRAAWCAELSRLAAELTAALAEVAATRHRAATTRAARRTALATLDRTRTGVAGVLAGLAVLAGRGEEGEEAAREGGQPATRRAA